MRVIQDVDEAAALLARGGLLVFPTETYYGLGCDPWQREAVARLLALKGRPEDQALPLVAGEVEQVERAAPGWTRVASAERLARGHWPGPLSLVLDAAGDLAPGVAAEDGSVAIRVSSHPVAAELARRLGRPVVATSANRSGSPPARACAAALEGLQAAAGELAGLDAGETPGGAPSTLVDPRRDPPLVLRSGAVDPSAVLGG
jgi:L-threonylcarbamoyladenylate synthase